MSPIRLSYCQLFQSYPLQTHCQNGLAAGLQNHHQTESKITHAHQPFSSKQSKQSLSLTTVDSIWHGIQRWTGRGGMKLWASLCPVEFTNDDDNCEFKHVSIKNIYGFHAVLLSITLFWMQYYVFVTPVTLLTCTTVKPERQCHILITSL